MYNSLKLVGKYKIKVHFVVVCPILTNINPQKFLLHILTTLIILYDYKRIIVCCKYKIFFIILIFF